MRAFQAHQFTAALCSAAQRSAALSCAAIISLSGGCAADPDTAAGASDHYLQSPLGYVPPPEVLDDLPIQAAPVTRPEVGADPVIVLEHRDSPPIELTIDNRGLSPMDVVVRPGQSVSIAVVNRTDEAHDLQVEMGQSRAELRGLLPGESRVLEFTAPQSPGVYVFTCPMHDHDRDGQPLQGRLIVQDSE